MRMLRGQVLYERSPLDLGHVIAEALVKSIPGNGLAAYERGGDHPEEGEFGEFLRGKMGKRKCAWIAFGGEEDVGIVDELPGIAEDLLAPIVDLGDGHGSHDCSRGSVRPLRCMEASAVGIIPSSSAT